MTEREQFDRQENWKKIHAALEGYAALASHMNDEVCQSYCEEWQRALEAVKIAEEEENRIANLEQAARATPALPYQPDEIPRLVECLKKANEQAEHFERQYYLLCDKVEELESRTPALPQAEHDLEDVRCQCCGYMTYHSEHMGCIRSAYKQALPQVPEGMAIVPAEPTLEMINAALPHAMRESDDEKYRAIGEIICIWYEMLAAAKEKGE